MNKEQYIARVLHGVEWRFDKDVAISYAPSNIALSKYWGKRNKPLNLPITDSISVSLDTLGAATSLKMSRESKDIVILNDIDISQDDNFYKRAVQYLDLFRPGEDYFFHLDTTSTVPVGAGLASSACGFASIALALNELFSWNLPLVELSKLARLGSGSASRSLWHGFVHWQSGNDIDGRDCYADKIESSWPELSVGILLLDASQKKYSSTEAMNITVRSSKLFKKWPEVCTRTNAGILNAIHEKDFMSLARFSEESAIAMHATMLDSEPSIDYSLPGTHKAIEKVKQLRQDGVEVFFTQDAGPNIKLIFTEKYQEQVTEVFPNIKAVKPFSR